MTRRVIKASEIGEYVYCRRAWWLHHLHDVPSANVAAMRQGTRAHARHGTRVTLASLMMVGAYILLASALFGALLWFVAN